MRSILFILIHFLIFSGTMYPCIKRIKDKLGKYDRNVPPQCLMMSDVELYRLDYLNSVLGLTKYCERYDRYIAQY